MFILSIKDNKFEMISPGTLDSPNIVDQSSHEVQLAKFHKHAKIKQGTPAKLLSCEKGFNVLDIR